MKRNEEYQMLLSALEQTPERLEHTVEQAVARNRALQKKRRILGIPAGTLAACFLGFVLLVNLFPPFAHACGSIPLLRELAKAVAWSPSLSAAVENDYVQPMGQRQTVNGITATMEYVIVDQKQVNIFFTLDGEGYDNLSAEIPELIPEQRCSVLGCAFRQPPGTLLHFTLDYMEENVPDRFTLQFGVTTWKETDADEMPEAWDIKDDLLHPKEEPKPEILAEFSFDLEFDPTYTVQGRLVPIDQTFALDGQTLTLSDAEIYPTHMRLQVTGAEENTAWLTGLDFYLENEAGERFETISNGISATGNAVTPEYTSFRLESSYFSESAHMTLYLTESTWLDKEMERVHLDLEQKTADRLPEGVTFTSAEHRENGWVLEFEVEGRRENTTFQPWGMTFWDGEGNAYEMNCASTTTGDDGKRFTVTLPLPDYHEKEVWLKPYYSSHVVEETPVAIRIS